MFSVAFLVTFLCSSILAPARNTNAETVTESSSASGYTLSLSATPVVNLNVGVLEVPVMTVGVGTVSTSTTAPGGYKLYLSMAGTSNDLRRTGSDGDTISATTGTMADSSALGIGEWGYAIPSTTPNISATDFDTSYDIMESAYPSSKGFAAPPISTATAQLITSTPSANETENDEPVPDEVSIYYGVNADNTTELGTYTNSVLWTAVADAAQTAGATVSPTSASAAGGDTITVASTLFSTSTIDANIYMLTSAAWQDVSANPSHISSYSSMQMSGCTQSSSTPVTYTGCITPANDEGEDYHVYMDVPRYEKRYNADFTYESAEPTFWNISNMQDMTPELCASVTKPSSANISTIATTKAAYLANPGGVVPQRTLIDPRGSEPYKSYTIRKLADGNCWMTDSLALVGASGGTILTPADSNVSNNFTLSASNSGTWCTTSSAACDNQSMVLDSGNTSYGAYYNWYSATAGTGQYSTSSGNAPSSICPKGWRLPKGGSSGEFQALRNVYTSSTFGDDWRNTPLNFVFAGYRNGSSTDNASTIGYYWSSTTYDSNGAYRLRLSSSSVNPAHDGGKYNGLTVRCVAENRDLFSISNMQDMNVTICENTTTPTASATASDTNGSHKGNTSYVPTKTLKDTRDSKTYTVKKLADGRCWMTDNLRLKNYTLKASDSNVTSDGFVVPNQASGTSYNTSYVFDSGSTDYGVYYSWYAATAGAGMQSQTGDTSTSVCPKGWRLPKGGSSGEFQSLYNKYNSASAMMDTNGPNFKLAGNRSGSSTSNASTNGYYWSSTAYDSYRAYYLDLNSSSVDPADYSTKYHGLAVRCIDVN